MRLPLPCFFCAPQPAAGEDSCEDLISRSGSWENFFPVLGSRRIQLSSRTQGDEGTPSAILNNAVFHLPNVTGPDDWSRVGASNYLYYTYLRMTR